LQIDKDGGKNGELPQPKWKYWLTIAGVLVLMLRGRSENCGFLRMFAAELIHEYCRDDAKLIQKYIEDYNRRNPAAPIQISMTFTTPPEAQIATSSSTPAPATVIDPRYPQVPLAEVEEQAPALRVPAVSMDTRDFVDCIHKVVDLEAKIMEEHNNRMKEHNNRMEEHNNRMGEHNNRMEKLLGLLQGNIQAPRTNNNALGH
jgi:hypothetical protein